MTAVLVIAGCAVSQKKKGQLETVAPESRINSGSLREWTYDFALSYADQIEEAADQIGSQAQTPEIRRNALMWKINAIKAGFRAAARRDALEAFMDLWILCRQMNEFFDTGAGKDCFGASQSIAVDTCRALEAGIESIVLAMFKPEDAERKLADGRRFAAKYASDSPLQSLYIWREPLSGRPETQSLPASTGFGQFAAGLEQDFNALQRLVAACAEYMPTIALWQAQLMLYDASEIGFVGESVAALKDIPVQIHEGMTRDVSQIVASELTRTLSAIREERMASLAGIEDMRSATLKFVEQERATLVAEIDKQRLATIEDVRIERKAAMDEVKVIVRDGTGSALTGGRDLIDHFVTRLMYLLGAFALFIVVFGAALVVLMRPRRLPGKSVSI